MKKILLICLILLISFPVVADANWRKRTYMVDGHISLIDPQGGIWRWLCNSNPAGNWVCKFTEKY